MKLYMFRTVPLSIIRSFSLYTQQWYMLHRFSDSLRAGSEWNIVPSWCCLQAASIPVWHIPLLYVQWENPDDGQKNCPKHVEFHSKNKFEKLVHLVGFNIRNCTRCTVTWTSYFYLVCGRSVSYFLQFLDFTSGLFPQGCRLKFDSDL
jgi:hypothetical protein